MKKLYLRIGKTAGTSLSTVLSKDDRIIEVAPSLKDRKKFEHYEYDFKFTFVRNPYDRIVSAYKMLTSSKKAREHYLLANHDELIGISFLNFIKKVIELRSDAKKYGIRKMNNIYVRPSSFARNIFKSRRLAYEYYWILAHTESMTDSIQFFISLNEFDFIGRYECLEEDVNTLAQILSLNHEGKQLKLPKLNVSEQRTSYQEYYDQESYDLVTALYAEDLTNFGYKFDNGPDRSGSANLHSAISGNSGHDAGL